MNVLLFGADGNMGRRYRAILKHLGHTFVPIEAGYTVNELNEKLGAVDKVLIASPTHAHWDNLIDLKFAKFQIGRNEPLDVLCEKPIVQSSTHLERLHELTVNGKLNLYVVNQYQYLFDDACYGNYTVSSVEYDYWNSGKDGLLWDCFQIIAMAEGGTIVLKNESPYWRCRMHGWTLSPGRMDFAYIDMVADFLTEQKNLWGLDVIEKTTRKILEMQKCEARA